MKALERAPGAARAPSPVAAPPPDATGGAYHPPRNTHVETAALSPGTIAVELRDADDRPVPRESVLLAQVADRPARDVGEETDAHGQATLSVPSWVGSTARVVSRNGECLFWTDPFAVPTHGGVRVVLHTYACSRELEVANTVFQSVVFLEAEGSALKVTQSLRTLSFGRIAWLSRMTFDLAQGARRFEYDLGTESPLSVENHDGHVSVAGTLSPGTHDVEMTWRLPLANDHAHFRVAMPPHLAAVRVVAVASPKTRLVVTDLPASTSRANEDSTVLLTERQLLRSEPPLTYVEIDAQAVARTKP